MTPRFDFPVHLPISPRHARTERSKRYDTPVFEGHAAEVLRKSRRGTGGSQACVTAQRLFTAEVLALNLFKLKDLACLASFSHFQISFGRLPTGGRGREWKQATSFALSLYICVVPGARCQARLGDDSLVSQTLLCLRRLFPGSVCI